MANRLAGNFKWKFYFPNSPWTAFVVAHPGCNLDCGYCNEHTRRSHPVPMRDLDQRIDRLAGMFTGMVMLTGGEPLFHPEIDQAVRRIRANYMVAGLITNGYLLDAQRIDELNRAGLDTLQISIDNLVPDQVSRKSLSVLGPKLILLSERAEFEVTVNSVFGAGDANPEDILRIRELVKKLHLNFDFGLIHSPGGTLKPLSPRHLAVYEQLRESRGSDQPPSWQDKLMTGQPLDWHCPAGGAFLYIDENGLVSWCSQQRGYPGIPLGQYSRQHLLAQKQTVKPCAPTCTLGCVHLTNWADWFSGNRTPIMKAQLLECIGAKDADLPTPPE